MPRQKRMLIVAFETPPSNGASVQRIISVYEHFIKAGWIVDVLTAAPQAYERTLDDGYVFAPESTIIRAPALDVHRHMSFKGKYFGPLVRPDRWGLTWKVSSKFACLSHIIKKRPDVIWSSSPIPSVHEIAIWLKKKTDAFWIADYRDPMSHLQGGKDASLNRLLAKIDKQTVRLADLLTFATEEMLDTYIKHYPDFPVSQKGQVIKNGFVEQRFSEFTNAPLERSGSLSLYYAGVLYPNGRDPSPLFDAISKKTDVSLTFQGAGDGLEYAKKIQTLNILDRVSFKPSVSFGEAIKNMSLSDALVLIQGERFNAQIPGKLYEYLRTGKPILLITPQGSATDIEAKRFDGVYQCSTSQEIETALSCIASGDRWHKRDVSEFSREHQAKKLESLISLFLGEK